MKIKREPNTIPAGTAFLVSALMIYPAFSSITFDNDSQKIRFDLRVDCDSPSSHEACSKLGSEVDKATRFTHTMIGLDPQVSQWEAKIENAVFFLSWERDLATLTEQEVDIVHDFIMEYLLDENMVFESDPVDGEQFSRFEQVFGEMFYQVQEVSPPIRLRAYRDMGTIYVHPLPACSDKERPTKNRSKKKAKP